MGSIVLNIVRISEVIGSSFLSCVCYVFVRVCLYVLCGHLLEKV